MSSGGGRGHQVPPPHYANEAPRQGSRRSNYEQQVGGVGSGGGSIRFSGGRTNKSPSRESQHQGTPQMYKYAGGPTSSSSGSSGRHNPNNIPHSQPMAGVAPVAPSTGQFRSGHIEVDTLYGAGGPANRQLVVNSMNAPNNSTMQCGCENIDCPFCNLMMSVQMKEGY